MYRPNVARCIGRMSHDHHRQLTEIYRPIVTRLSTESRPMYRPTADRLLIDSWPWYLPTLDWPSADSWQIYIGQQSTNVYQPTVDRRSAENWPKYIDRLRSDYQPTVDRYTDRLPTNCRPNDHHRGHVQRSKKAWSLISPFGNKLIRKIPLVERSCVCLTRLCL